MKYLSILIVWIFAFLSNSCSTKAVIEKKKPNILFLLVDDLGWADLGYTGSTFYETPNIDKLAAEGTVFTDAYAACPVCSPSRAAIMSGKSPARLNLTDYIPGNRHWGPHKDQMLASHPFKLQLDLEEYTIAEAFKDAGYKTMFAGKWHAGEEEKYYPQYQGFDINIAGNKTGHPAGGYFSPYKNPQLEDGEDGEYLTDRLTDEVIHFIEQERQAPFFAYLSFYTVHLPLQGKPEKVDKYKKKLALTQFTETGFIQNGKTWFKNHQNMPHYAAMVESMDENVGRILETLQKHGLDKNTIVVFTSDNGGMSTSNQTGNIPTTNFPLRAGKGYLYEGGIRVPLIIKHSEKFKGETCSTAVTGTDLYPTLLDLSGLDLLSTQHSDGISLKPLLENKELEERPVFWHYPHYSGGLGGRPSGAVRLGDYKLIEFYEDMHVELYNLENDMEEKQDLSLEMPEKVEELVTLLQTYREELGAKMPYSNPHYKN